MNQENECEAIQTRVEQVSIISETGPGAAFQIGMQLQSVDDPEWIEVFALTVEEARRLADGLDRGFEAIKALQATN